MQKMDNESNDENSDVENMTIQLQNRRCSGIPEVVCSDKNTRCWSPKTCVWRVTNAAMVVFFVTAAYVQVREVHGVY